MTIRDNGPLRILHLSDTHLAGDGSLHYGLVDTSENLTRVLDRASALSALDLVVISGDLSEDGSAESYANLKGVIEPWAFDRGAVVAYSMGNHDIRSNFEEALGARFGSKALGGYRIIWLDSSVPGQGYGVIDDAQLSWLRSELATSSEFGTVLVVHHPPIGAESALLRALELRHPEELISLCASSDVRVILSGHYHAAIASSVAGVPVFVAPGVANSSDPFAPMGTERATFSCGFCVVDIRLDGAVRMDVVSVPGPRDGEQIFSLGREEVLKIVEGFGTER